MTPTDRLIVRGCVVTVALPGDYGKPRPALVIQADRFNVVHDSIVICLFSSNQTQHPVARIEVSPNAGNGLRKPSHIQIDKILTVPAQKIGEIIGTVDEQIMLQVNRALAVWLGIA